MTKNSQLMNSSVDESELIKIRHEKLNKIIEKGLEPFGGHFEVTYHAKDIHEKFANIEGDVNAEEVSVAGRLMAIRGHGKASFATISDRSGMIQIYFKLDVIGDEKYSEFKLLDIGDIIGVNGSIFKTKCGELTIRVEDFKILAKSLRPLPEKFHGLKDVETRYRQRYLDLIMNPEVHETFLKRTKIIQSIRNYLDSKDFVEVETPILSTIAGGAMARPFLTHHNALNVDLYLRIATELNLKRLIIGGLERVYEIGKVFRNEGMDIRHNPEFTSVEIYQAYSDYHDLIRVTEEIICEASRAINGTTKIFYQDTEMELENIPQISMNDIVREKTGKDFLSCTNVEEARTMAKDLGVAYEERFGIGGILNAIFEEKISDNLIQPVFVTHHPTEVSPLAKKNFNDPRVTDRFELFVYGRELANGFSELNDPIDQRKRFEEQCKQRAAGNDEAHVMDEDFVRALEYGMPPTGGLGVGIDRLVMLLTDSTSIRDVLFFPTMKNISE